MAIIVILTWLFTGPVFGFTTQWQLFINTFTTITTFLMVFLIQNTESRDTAALHLKLNELLRIHKEARNILLAAEEFSDRELKHHRSQFHEFARRVVEDRGPDDGHASHHE